MVAGDMMRIGIDIAQIERFTFVFRPGGSAFYQRVFTVAEQETLGENVELVTLCFTAKEAVSKVLGTGLSIGVPDNVSCREIEILCPSGLKQPKVGLRGRAQQYADKLGISEVMLRWCRNYGFAWSLAGGASDGATAVDLRSALERSLREVGMNEAWQSRWRQ